MNPHEERQATILSFPRRRGRPRKDIPRIDTGTPELIMKRLLGETTESLDLCLERRIISNEQHWCGIHLRWLYTLRHGAPGVRAMDPTHIPGLEPKNDDPFWRAEREKEYADALSKLGDSGHALLIVNLCIYNERPAFLRVPPKELRQQATLSRNIIQIRDGLDILVKCWIADRPKKGR